jgi:hypothetical protein
MAITIGEVTTAITEAQQVGDQVLKAVEGFLPANALPAAMAGTVLDLASQLVVKALTAWSAASGVAITPASVLALLPDQTPVVPPTTS